MAESTTSSMDDFQRLMGRLKLFALVIVLVVVGVVGYWGYRMFLDPAGRLDWSWEATESSDLLVVQEGNLVVRVGETIRVVDPSDGREIRRIENPLLQSGSVTYRSDGFLVTTAMGMAMVGPDGKTRYEITLGADPDEEREELAAFYELDRELTKEEMKQVQAIRAKMAARPMMSELIVATDDSAAYAVITTPGEDADSWQRDSTVVCVDLKTGAERWRSPTYPAAISISSMVATGDALAMVMSRQKKDSREEDIRFVAFSAADGKILGKIDLEDDPEWEPVAVDDSFVINYAPYKVAVLDGAFAQRFAVELPQNDDDIDMVAKDGHLVMMYPAATIAYDLATGKGVWSVPVEIGSEDDIIFTKKHVVILGSKSERMEGDITSMPGFNQHEDMVKDMGLDKATQSKTVPVLLVLDRASGKSLWSKDHVLGYVVASDTRLAVVMDTAVTRQFQMVRSDASEIVVRQFNLDSGKRYYSRTTPAMGIADVMIVGDHVVGLTYDPTQQDDGYGLIYGVSSGKLAGFNLR